MTLRDTMKRHAVGPLTRVDHFGETVTFRPKSGAAVSIAVVIDRSMRLDPISDSRSLAVARAAAVFIPRTSTVTRVVEGDQLDCALTDEGGTVTTCRVDEILATDPGGWLVRVQK